MKKLFLLIIIFSCLNIAITKPLNKRKFPQITIRDSKLFDVNNISGWITNYGSLFRHPLTGNSGFEWPKGSGKFAIYAAGLWLGAKVNGKARVAVAEYSYEYQPGSIDELTHLPVNPEDSTCQVIEDDNPLNLGHRALYMVFNDADSNAHVNMGTLPLCIEVQLTVFGWDATTTMNDVIFLHWLIINKGINYLDSVYFSIWCDPDLGDSGDDFVGCDTVNSLGYCYNSSDYDEDYGNHPPSVGFQILQGPFISSISDTGIFMGWKRPGYTNLPMTSFVMYNSADAINGNPQNAKEIHYFMQSRWRDGKQITYGDRGTDPIAPPCNYMFAGDPETGVGWLDDWSADRRFLMSSGPFDLAPGDSQEVVTASLITRGESHLNSVTKLKINASQIKALYNDSIYEFFRNYHFHPGSDKPQIIEKLGLFPNYPNPFNKQTKLKYRLPIARAVRLEIFNTLGEKVAILVNKHQEPDVYEVVWDASGLPSGLYIAHLKVAQYVLSRKLLLLK